MGGFDGGLRWGALGRAWRSIPPTMKTADSEPIACSIGSDSMKGRTTKTQRPRRILTGLTGLTGWGQQKGSRPPAHPNGLVNPVNPVNPVKFQFAFVSFVSSWFIPAALCLFLAGCRLPARG